MAPERKFAGADFRQRVTNVHCAYLNLMHGDLDMAESNSRRNLALAGLAFLVIVVALVLFFALGDDGSQNPGFALSGNAGQETRRVEEHSEPVSMPTTNEPDAAAKLSPDEASEADPAEEEPAQEEGDVLPPEAEPFTMTIKGKVVDKDNQPIEGAKVEAVPASRTDWERGPKGKHKEVVTTADWPKRVSGEVLSAADGSFRLVVEGYTVEVDPDTGHGVFSVFLWRASKAGFIATEGGCWVDEDSAHEDLVIPLFAAGVVEGYVTTESGKPLPGLAVGLSCASSGPSALKGWNADWDYPEYLTIAPSECDEKGYYRIEKVPASVWDIQVSPREHSIGDEGAFRYASLPRNIHVVGDTHRVDFVLPDLGSAEFRLSDESVKEVQVQLWDDGDPSQVSLDGRRLDELELTAGEGGQFVIGGLTSRNTHFYLKAPGYLEEEVKLKVVPGKRIDLGVIALQEALTIHGVVVDPQGKPVEGASVQLKRTPIGGPSTYYSRGLRSAFAADEVERYDLAWPSDEDTRSDENGEFVFTGIDPGEIEISAYHEDFAAGSTELQITGPWGNNPSGKPPIITLNLALAGIAWGIFRPTPALQDLKPHSVTLIKQQMIRSSVDTMSEWDIIRAAALQRGLVFNERFEARGLTPGKWVALVQLGDIRIASEPFDVEAGKESEIVFPNPEFASVSGRITDASGAPLAEHHVYLSRKSNWYGPSEADVETDANGAYRFELVKVGTYYLHLEADRVPGQHISRVLGESRRIEVIAGRDNVKDISLEESPKARVFGKILVKGKPYFVNTLLRLEASTGEEKRAEEFSVHSEFTSEGNYEFKGLLAGRYKFSCYPDWNKGGGARYYSTLEIRDDESEREYNLDLKAYSLKGKLSGDLAGLDLTEATLEVREPAGEAFQMIAELRLDADGSFHFPLLWPDEYVLHCEIDGRTSSEMKVTLDRDLSGVDFLIGERTGSIKATIASLFEGEMGAPPQNSSYPSASLLDSAGQPVRAMSTQAQVGRNFGVGYHWTLSKVAPGSYTLRCYKYGYARVDIPVHVRAGETTHVDVNLKRNGELKISIEIPGTDKSSDLSALKISALSPGATEESAISSKMLGHREGSSWILYYPIWLPGTTAIRAEFPGYTAASATINLEAAKKQTVNLTLTR